MTYWRPILHADPALGGAVLAGGWMRFTHVEVLHRDHPAEVVPATEIPATALERLTSARAAVCGLDLSQPRIMGVLNVTPDSFSDGGDLDGLAAVASRARVMVDAHILDIGGESTRPGAAPVRVADELERVVPAIASVREAGIETPISIDTRKAAVADAAIAAGAGLFNDVSALTYDPDSAGAARRHRVPVCLMHASGDPRTMQDNPSYENVVLDVYDYLSERVAAAEAAGIDRSAIIVDPGIGFGKTKTHNLTLIRHLSLFHGLGCPVLLGVSRKRFIGDIGQAQAPKDRFPGSIAVALEGVRQGAQILRVHDVADTAQALRLQAALAP